MPSTTEPQRKLMEAAAADPEVAKRKGIPQKVAREFRAADRAKARKKKRLSVRGAAKKAMRDAKS